jgi:hypothetical protein
VHTKTGKWTVITMLVKGIDCAYQDREVDSDYIVRVSIVPTKTGKWTEITMLVKGIDCAYQDKEVDSDYNVSKGYRLCLPRQGSGQWFQW